MLLDADQVLLEYEKKIRAERLIRMDEGKDHRYKPDRGDGQKKHEKIRLQHIGQLIWPAGEREKENQ